jgi:tetratricopeptide (TPR) repeat protein
MHMVCSVYGVNYTVVGPESKEALTAAINLSNVLKNIKKVQAAEDLLQESLVISKRVHGETSSLTATILNNIGIILKNDPIRQTEARSFYEEALRIRSYSLGNNHPDTVVSMNNLAELYLSLGFVNEAKTLQEGILEILGGKEKEEDKEGQKEEVAREVVVSKSLDKDEWKPS